jgi:hypothetical protein
LEHRDSAIDSLCCGITTLRDGNGVVVPGNVASLSDEDRERLISAGYAHDEMFPDVTLPAAMDVISLDWGYVNNLRVSDLSAGNWRDFISAGLPVEGALAGAMFDLIRDGISRLAPHLQHALACRPYVIKLAAERAVRPSHRGDGESRHSCLMPRN